MAMYIVKRRTVRTLSLPSKPVRRGKWGTVSKHGAEFEAVRAMGRLISVHHEHAIFYRGIKLSD